MKNKNTVLRILKYVMPHWYLILASTVAGVIKLTLPLVLPQVVKHFTDDVLISGNFPTAQNKIDEVWKWLVILLALYLFVYIPAAYIRQAAATEVSNRIMHIMRNQVYGYLQKMSASFHQKNKSGELVTRIDNDVEKVHGFVWNVATNIWIDAIVLLVYLWLMGSVNLPLTILAAVVLPLSVLITKKIRMHIRKESKKVQQNFSQISGYMQERMAGYATVKLFNMEGYEEQRFNQYSKELYEDSKRVNHYFSIGEAVTGALSEIICSLIVCLSAVLIVKGEMTVGDLIIFYAYLGYFITPLRRFAELNVTYARSIAGIERVFEILDTPIDIREKEEAAELSENVPMNIEFRNVSFGYTEGYHNVSDISLMFCEGEKVALVGSSGCGKTTLVNLLARFYEVNQGSILIGGTDIRDYSLYSLYRQMGMVFQDTVLFSGTIEENIRYGKQNASMEELEQAVRAANAYDFIMSTPDKWDTMLGERGIGLSGGQKQRLAIARVFLKNPRLLILDEATSALDSESEELVQDALDHLMANRTSIVIAHRLTTIVNADRIIVMDKGRIVEEGRHEELLKKNGRYSELYHMQFDSIFDGKVSVS